MTKDYGALLAQVIPVLLLALTLELRAILNASREEYLRMRELGLSPKEEVLVTTVRRAAARVLRLQPPVTDAAGPPEGTTRMTDRLSRVDAFGFTAMYGILLLALVRTEIVALAAARGGTVPDWEMPLASLVVFGSLGSLVVVSVGLEVYRHFGGPSWSGGLFLAYGACGLIVASALTLSVHSYM